MTDVTMLNMASGITPIYTGITQAGITTIWSHVNIMHPELTC